MKRTESYYHSPAGDTASPVAYVSALGIRETMHPQMLRHGGEWFPYYVLIGFHDPVRLRISDGSWVESAPDVVLWPSGVVRAYGHPVETWNHTWVNFSGSTLAQLVRDSQLPVMTPLGVGDTPITLHYANLLFNELHGRSQQDPEMVSGIIHLWLHALTRARRERAGGGTDLPESIVRARHFIDAHLADAVTLEEIAEAAALSPTQLNRLFHRHFGMAPFDFLIHLRVERAKSFLLGQHASIREVALRVGFDDPLYFSRQFRSRVGVSPARFRTMLHARPPAANTHPEEVVTADSVPADWT